MPFPKRQAGKKKLNPQYVEDPSARNNFELITDNVNEIFKRIDQVRWAISESSESYSYAGAASGIVRPPMLKVKLPNVTGKRPVLVMLVQISENVAAGSTVGGLRLVGETGASFGAESYFFLGNATEQRVFHGVVLGFQTHDSIVGDPPAIAREIYYPACAVMGIDLYPRPGAVDYEFMFATLSTLGNMTLNIQDCQLFAVELF